MKFMSPSEIHTLIRIVTRGQLKTRFRLFFKTVVYWILTYEFQATSGFSYEFQATSGFWCVFQVAHEFHRRLSNQM